MILKGSSPTDGGGLLLDENEKTTFISSHPESNLFIKPFIGSDDFINGKRRYCLWIKEEQLAIASTIPMIEKRVERVRVMRLSSKKEATKKDAERAFQFSECRYKETESIIIPRHSSENRKYIPIGFLSKGNVVADSAFAIYDAPMWLFGILTSKMHMAWVKTVGGRLKTDYRYSAQLCYNTFPFPKISEGKKNQIEAAAEEVLLCREDYPDKTLADLYDPDKMPDNLRQAHHTLDLLVESCYQDTPFESDEERLECLFKLYEKMTKKGK